MSTRAAIIRTVFDIDNNFDEIRIMNRYELKSYIKKNRSIQVKIMSRNYSESDRIVSSKVIYAKNRLRLM
ncbi:MAG: hypothetical protein CMD28_02125 [Flavobacteriales bacterium]|nr:hypothetical protein [Flavobacteriales bacterium]|tara:strand:- start:472 stop:681 length:210 start_codon:yes stop_codon:yes gene_type:complete